MPPVIPRLLEELTLNAWPPLQTLLFDGWLLGFSEGYTRRANSAQPLYASSLPIADKIAACEAIYRARERPLTFKIASDIPDTELDAQLERRGYPRIADTSVQIAPLESPLDVDSGVVLSTLLTDAWFADLNRLTHTPPQVHASERRLLEKIVPPHCFASISLDGEAVAIGLGVAERGFVGLFDIVVDVRVRNQGLGRRLCSSLLAWGQQSEAAHTAYLAVMQDNAPARHLYAQLGYREAYTYWYRTEP
jgi:N-acetylglutamate synthase